MDRAPMLRTDKGRPDTTARHVLSVLAEHANSQGRNSHPSLARIQYRTGYDRRTAQRALRRLEAGGLIAKDGVVDGRTRWRLAMHLQRPESDWEEIEAAEDADRARVAERVRKHRAKKVTHAEGVTETDSASVTEPDVTHSDDVTGPDVTHSASVRNGSKVRYKADVTHSASVCNALSAALTTINHQKNQPPLKPSAPPSSDPSGAAAADAERETAEPTDALFDNPGSAEALAAAPLASKPMGKRAPARKTDEDPAFAEFWKIYPRRVNKAAARKKWDTAIKNGADPADIIAGARAYASNPRRAASDIGYTAHAATWLHNERWNDEPEPVHDTAGSGVGASARVNHIDWSHGPTLGRRHA
jgi:hypothetical protein